MSGATISLKSLRGKMSAIKENICVEDGTYDPQFLFLMKIMGWRVQSKPKNLHVKEDQVIQITLFQVL